jgi:hypothetical protein
MAGRDQWRVALDGSRSTGGSETLPSVNASQSARMSVSRQTAAAARAGQVRFRNTVAAAQVAGRPARRVGAGRHWPVWPLGRRLRYTSTMSYCSWW